jgi:hypothetical protein
MSWDVIAGADENLCAKVVSEIRVLKCLVWVLYRMYVYILVYR